MKRTGFVTTFIVLLTVAGHAETVGCTKSGNTTYCTDGTVETRAGNTTYISNFRHHPEPVATQPAQPDPIELFPPTTHRSEPVQPVIEPEPDLSSLSIEPPIERQPERQPVPNDGPPRSSLRGSNAPHPERLPAITPTLEGYLTGMRSALSNYGVLRPSGNQGSCLLEIVALHMGYYALPSSVAPNGELLWTLFKNNVTGITVDLSRLDEDKVPTVGVFSANFIKDQQHNERYAPDVTMVELSADGSSGMGNSITANTVDLEKIAALHGQVEVTEKMVGLSIQARKAVLMEFEDKQHAELFAKAVRKAIVVCKAR